MVRVLWPETEAEPVVQPEPALPCLLLQDFQPFVPPYPFHPIVVHMPAGVVQQSGDHPIAVPPIQGGEREDVGGQRLFIGPPARRLPLGSAVPAQDAAGEAFQNAELLPDVINARSAGGLRSFADTDLRFPQQPS
jgi:hypothetical protein